MKKNGITSIKAMCGSGRTSKDNGDPGWRFNNGSRRKKIMAIFREQTASLLRRAHIIHAIARFAAALLAVDAPPAWRTRACLPRPSFACCRALRALLR